MRRRLLFSAATAWAVSLSYPAAAEFSGDLAFEPEGCMEKLECVLKSPITFTDAMKRVWKADAGDVTDGASIPDWAQSIIGMRWDTSYLKAAVLHDHYCGKRTASWRDTHLMFYNALIELGVNEYKAKVMYYAVYAAGPRWLDIVAPTCGPGTKQLCGDRETLDVVGQVHQAADYNKLRMEKDVKDVKDYMDIHPDTTIEDLQAMALAKHPDDPFLSHGDAVRIGAPLDRFMKSMK